MTRAPLSFALLLVAATVAACGGATGGDDGNGPAAASGPPPANTRFTLTIDDRNVALAPPTATRFVQKDGSSFVSVTAREPERGGDYERLASMLVAGTVATGTVDCTPGADGAVRSGASISVDAFFGFTATITDCQITLEYTSADRVVGRYSMKAHPPDASSLAGKVAVASGEFDVPVERTLQP